MVSLTILFPNQPTSHQRRDLLDSVRCTISSTTVSRHGFCYYQLKPSKEKEILKYHGCMHSKISSRDMDANPSMLF
jgi:hypothetical protein